jgi:hypothetical protein
MKVFRVFLLVIVLIDVLLFAPSFCARPQVGTMENDYGEIVPKYGDNNLQTRFGWPIGLVITSSFLGSGALLWMTRSKHK